MVKLSDGSEIVITYLNGSKYTYAVTGSIRLPYGTYPEAYTKYQIATCYSGINGEWAGLELYQLKLIRAFHPRLFRHR